MLRGAGGPISRAALTGPGAGIPLNKSPTFPPAAMRSGDFSSIAGQLIDPATGLPFSNNQIPASRMDPTSLALLRFIPLPNLDGTDRNYHSVTTNQSTLDNVNVRVTHSFTQNTGRGGAGGRGG